MVSFQKAGYYWLFFIGGRDKIWNGCCQENITDLDEIGFLFVLVMFCQKIHMEVIIMDYS